MLTYQLHWSLGVRNIIPKNLIFFPHFSTLQVGVFFNYFTYYNAKHILIKLVFKKECNCNIMTMWPCYMISLVIISNSILLSSLIVFIYHFNFIGLHSWYLKSDLFIIGNRLSNIALLKIALAVIVFVQKRSIHHLVAVPISTHQYIIYLDVIFFN